MDMFTLYYIIYNAIGYEDGCNLAFQGNLKLIEIHVCKRMPGLHNKVDKYLYTLAQ